MIGLSLIAIMVMIKVVFETASFYIKQQKLEVMKEKLQKEIDQLLNKYHDEGKNPNPIAKGMSWMKTNMKMGWDESDATVADLLTDGCDMGIKSLYRYLNQYKDAEQEATSIAKRLIDIEAKLETELRKYL